jgi:hypothetical protein
VADAWDLVFTSNRAEDTVGIFDARDPAPAANVAVARPPNGLAYDPVRRALLVANVGDCEDAASHSLTIVDTDRAIITATISVAPATR